MCRKISTYKINIYSNTLENQFASVVFLLDILYVSRNKTHLKFYPVKYKLEVYFCTPVFPSMGIVLHTLVLNIYYRLSVVQRWVN